jgi:hypothetical protein
VGAVSYPQMAAPAAHMMQLGTTNTQNPQGSPLTQSVRPGEQQVYPSASSGQYAGSWAGSNSSGFAHAVPYDAHAYGACAKQDAMRTPSAAVVEAVAYTVD